MKNIKIKLSKRLLTIAGLIDPCDKMSDIGTDHAYLPIHLIQEGRVRTASASDINQGPIERAEKNIKEYGLSDSITVYKAPGLLGVEKFSPDLIVIAGMGGELIRDILASSDYVKQKCPKLILQPMTQQHELRKWLWGNGFEIYDEALVEEEDHIYQIICSKYTGRNTSFCEAESIIGKINISKKNQKLKKLLNKNIKALSVAKCGKESAGINTAKEEEILIQLENILRNSNEDQNFI